MDTLMSENIPRQIPSNFGTSQRRMWSLTNPPSKFVPFDRLNVGSNLLVGCHAIFDIGGMTPLLIGKGPDLPVIWLASFNDFEWSSLIVESGRAIEDLLIFFRPINSTRPGIDIRLYNNSILSLDIAAGQCFITALDLRPIGFSVFQKDNSLFIGGGVYVGNMYSGISTIASFN